MNAVYDILLILFVDVLLYAIPLAVLGMFVFSLIRYIRGKLKHRRDPESITPAELRGRRILLIVFGSIFGIMLLAVTALLLLAMSAIVYM